MDFKDDNSAIAKMLCQIGEKVKEVLSKVVQNMFIGIRYIWNADFYHYFGNSDFVT